jgi:hypothetical protein
MVSGLKFKGYQHKYTVSYQIQEVENGTEITVQADEAAVIVREDGEERIYLPGNDHKYSTYYTSDRKSLNQKENGFTIVHGGTPDTVKVFST